MKSAHISRQWKMAWRTFTNFSSGKLVRRYRRRLSKIYKSRGAGSATAPLLLPGCGAAHQDSVQRSAGKIGAYPMLPGISAGLIAERSFLAEVNP